VERGALPYSAGFAHFCAKQKAALLLHKATFRLKYPAKCDADPTSFSGLHTESGAGASSSKTSVILSHVASDIKQAFPHTRFMPFLNTLWYNHSILLGTSQIKLAKLHQNLFTLAIIYTIYREYREFPIILLLRKNHPVIQHTG
jgi:hypothetical protein